MYIVTIRKYIYSSTVPYCSSFNETQMQLFATQKFLLIQWLHFQAPRPLCYHRGLCPLLAQMYLSIAVRLWITSWPLLLWLFWPATFPRWRLLLISAYLSQTVTTGLFIRPAYRGQTCSRLWFLPKPWDVGLILSISVATIFSILSSARRSHDSSLAKVAS